LAEPSYEIRSRKQKITEDSDPPHIFEVQWMIVPIPRQLNVIISQQSIVFGQKKRILLPALLKEF